MEYYNYIVDVVEAADAVDTDAKQENEEQKVSETENKKDDEVSSSTTKPTKKKTASAKRLKKGPKSVDDVKE